MKKHPLRTCIGCKVVERRDKLMRLVLNKKSEAVVDNTGKALGRGAYVCSQECLKKAIEEKRLARALRLKTTALKSSNWVSF